MIDRLAPTCVTHALPPPALQSTAQQCVYVLVFVEVERSVCGHRGACCTSATVFLVGSCAFCYFVCGRVGLVAPCVPHPRLPTPSYRQSSSVYMYMYLSRWSGACGGTGALAARRQPCFLVGSCAFIFFLWDMLVAPRVTYSPLFPPSYRQRSSVCIDLYLSR